jgi:hypothetical protein
MPARQLEIDGRQWAVYPSGFVTANGGDEVGLLFVQGSGPAAVMRSTRLSAPGGTGREALVASLSDAELRRLFRLSQASVLSPEAGYRA